VADVGGLDVHEGTSGQAPGADDLGDKLSAAKGVSHDLARLRVLDVEGGESTLRVLAKTIPSIVLADTRAVTPYHGEQWWNGFGTTS